MDKFEIGEIAILWNPVSPEDIDWSRYHGDEVEIIAPLMLRRTECGKITQLCYLMVHPAFNNSWQVSPYELRKKNPPKDEDRYTGNDVISWGDKRCIWRPNEVGVV